MPTVSIARASPSRAYSSSILTGSTNPTLVAGSNQ